MIAVVDYGVGNLASVGKAFEHLGCDVKLTSNPDTVRDADAVVLPGVGAFDDAMLSLDAKGLKDPVMNAIKGGRPFLGICLGLQLLFESSEESGQKGIIKGLGIFNGTVRRFPRNTGLKVPHMGWNTVSVRKGCRLFNGIGDEPHLYFVHSYYLDACDSNMVASRTEYGVSFVSSVEYENVFATQFHPEKSGRVGLRMLENFIRIAGGKVS